MLKIGYPARNKKATEGATTLVGGKDMVGRPRVPTFGMPRFILRGTVKKSAQYQYKQRSK
jgi:hypothetical protein